MSFNIENRVRVNPKFIDSSDVYNAIKKCNSKKINITYCSLEIDNECINTRNVTIQIKKLHQNCNFIEGTIIRNNKPVEDIILKSSSIYSIECVSDLEPEDTVSIYDTINYCDGLVRMTVWNKIEKGKCIQKTSFPFLATSVDKKNKLIKGYRIRANQPPEYIVLDERVVLAVDCITNKNTPNFPWWILPALMKQY